MINTPKDYELKLLGYTRKAAVHAELVTTCEKHLDVISHNGARNARKDVLQAIDMLQAFERLLSYRINEDRSGDADRNRHGGEAGDAETLMARRDAAVSMAIRYADEQIDAATRDLANLQRQTTLTRGSTLSWPALKEIREHAAIVRRERDAACRELAELIALAELPVELMGSA